MITKELINNSLLYSRQGSHLNGLGNEIQMDVLLKTKPLPAQLPTRQISKAIEKYQHLEIMIFYGTLKCVHIKS